MFPTFLIFRACNFYLTYSLSSLSTPSLLSFPLHSFLSILLLSSSQLFNHSCNLWFPAHPSKVQIQMCQMPTIIFTWTFYNQCKNISEIEFIIPSNLVPFFYLSQWIQLAKYFFLSPLLFSYPILTQWPSWIESIDLISHNPSSLLVIS